MYPLLSSADPGPAKISFHMLGNYVGDLFPGFPKKWGHKMPTCQSRRIAVWSLLEAFASVPPGRVSIDDLIYGPNGATATLIMNSTTSKIGLEAHIQHWTVSYD